MSMTKTLCRDVRKGLYAQVFPAVAAGAVFEVTFPRGVNRVLITSEVGVPWGWSVSEAGTAVDPPTQGQLAANMVSGTGIVTTNLTAIIEIQHGARSWKFRNLGAAASNPTIEGHIIGADN